MMNTVVGMEFIVGSAYNERFTKNVFVNVNEH